ncbi:MAG: peptide chain release factor N(5)-glutamine methyltransferase, partial [Prolixibacteraceae bacterium]|nr:peptide chain release factor N(5)-glutamine methyltransferase [Prolixibacteraceae bacterium]
MKPTIEYIKNSLEPFYPQSEIESFIAILFQYFLEYNTTQMLLNKDSTLSVELAEQIKKAVDRLKNSEPIQYILGETMFYDLRFEVDGSVLIPRGETEELVDRIVKKHKNKALKLLDIGTGSGAIAVSIKKNLPNADVFACDVSHKALLTAKKNASTNGVDVHFFYHDILSEIPLPERNFDVWVSNPPYVTEKEKALMERNVLDYEPHLALFVPDDDALMFYRAITEKAIQYLKPSGELWFEINEA